MSSYISYPIAVDAEDVLQDSTDYIRARFPSWVPNSPNLDAAMLQAWATEASQLRELASNLTDSIFRYFGASLIQLPPVDAAPASAQTTWTMVDAAGYTIPAGTQVSIDATGSDRVGFTVLADVVVPPGSAATAAGAVTIVAVLPGAAGDGLGTPGGTVHLEDPLAYVTSITQVLATSGGVDAEDDPTYLNRLKASLALMSPRLILPHDFAVAAMSVDNVWRALALDGYNPADSSSGNPRMIALAVVDSSGAALSAPNKTDVQLALEDRREVNFVVNIIDPTPHSIDVDYDVAAVEGYDLVDLVTRCDAALAAFLDPAVWGTDPSVRDAASARTWIQETKVRYLDVANILHNVEGVDHIISLTICLHSGVPGTIDINLTGAAPLASTGTITGAAS